MNTFGEVSQGGFAVFVQKNAARAFFGGLMKGIILSGGSGTRLYPATIALSKQMIPVYDKPMVYYPMSLLLRAGISEILLISTPTDLPGFKRLFGTGEDLGIKMSYAEQPSPDGLAQAFIIGEEFIGKDNVALVLGDNIFNGSALTKHLKDAAGLKEGGVIFGCYVNDPERYGVVEFDKDFNVVSIEEKPQQPKSHYAVPGLYFYDNDVVQIAKNLKPSARGELEITDVNKEYLRRGKLKVEIFNRDIDWFDTGTHDSLLQASSYVEAIEKRKGIKVACLEEIAYLNGFITREQVLAKAELMKKNSYGQYLFKLADEKIHTPLF